jgi:hypothetical protein
MRSKILLLSALSMLSASGCSTFESGAVYLDVFDCLIPVPAGYAFNTVDSSTTHAYSAEPGRRSWGELNVWNYDGPIPADRYEIIETRIRGRLEIQEIRLRERTEAGDSLIIVTDGVRKLSLGGDARRLVDSMVDACLATSH